MLLYNSRVIRRIFSLVVFLLASFCWCQTKTQLSYKLLSIHIKGLERLKEDQVVGATGLRLGSNVTEQDFQEAVRKLGDTGLFNDVAYNYHYSPAGCDLQIQLSENPRLVPILFENFVWFSDDELISLLRARVQLFEGKLPLSGSLADQVTETLNNILASRNISGRVEGIQSGELNGPIDAYTYVIKFHPVIVRNSDFPGATQPEVPALQAVARPIAGVEYLRSSMRAHEKLDLLPVFLSRGYLKADFSDTQAKIAQDGPRTLVDVSFPVKPGLQYRVAEVQWTGFSSFSQPDLQKQVHLKTGEPANAVQLGSDLEAVQKLYGTKGYLTTRVIPQPTFSDADATVAYVLQVNEGAQFRMGELLIDGIDPGSADKLRQQWQLKKGDVFDDSYLQRFFQVMYHDIGLNRSYSVVPKQTLDGQQKTVDVALHFVPKK